MSVAALARGPKPRAETGHILMNFLAFVSTNACALWAREACCPPSTSWRREAWQNGRCTKCVEGGKGGLPSPARARMLERRRR
eukprot:4962416-Pyramimonas_sp.AAC.1